MNLNFKYLLRALTLAKKGEGQVSPNPLVGAVIVENGKIIGEGFHEKFGGPHAEIEALKKMGSISKESIMFVTLEPCCFHGKTPPCTEAIIKAGVKKVVIGMIDPNKNVSGKGVKALEKAGIEVCLPNILQEELRDLNKSFIKYQTTKTPYVLLKMATTMNGKIAKGDLSSRWITGEMSKKKVHGMRGRYDAILVGVNTVINDNPNLGVRLIKGRDPVRVILDPFLKSPIDSDVFRDENVLIVTSLEAPMKNLNKFKARGIRIIIDQLVDKRFKLKNILRKLTTLGIISVMVEGGSNTYCSFLEEKLVDEINLFIAPKVWNEENDLSAFGERNIFKDHDFEIKDVRMFGSDVLLNFKLI